MVAKMAASAWLGLVFRGVSFKPRQSEKSQKKLEGEVIRQKKREREMEKTEKKVNPW